MVAPRRQVHGAAPAGGEHLGREQQAAHGDLAQPLHGQLRVGHVVEDPRAPDDLVRADRRWVVDVALDEADA